MGASVVYYVAIGLVAVLSHFLCNTTEYRELKVFSRTPKSFLASFVILLPFTFLILFRWNVGHDSRYGESYSTAYAAAAQGLNTHGFEEGFFRLCSVFSKLGVPFFWFLFFLGLVFMLCVSYGVSRASVSPLLSVITFLFLMVYFDAYASLRQGIVEGIAIAVFANVFTRPRTRKRDIICISAFLFSSLFHSIALIYLIVYIVCCVHIERKTLITLCVTFVMLYPVTQIILRTLMNVFTDNRYTFAGFASSYAIFTLVILAMCINNYDTICAMSQNGSAIINYSLIAFIFMFNSGALMLPFRFFDALKIGYVFIVPYVIRSTRKTEERVLFYIMIFALLGIWFFNAFYINQSVFADYQFVFPEWGTATRLP